MFRGKAVFCKQTRSAARAARILERLKSKASITRVGRTWTKAGVFQTVLVEMRVKDPRNYRGEGVIRVHLTDDGCRLPVRIESTISDVGKTVLTLESATRPDGRCVTRDR